MKRTTIVAVLAATLLASIMVVAAASSPVLRDRVIQETSTGWFENLTQTYCQASDLAGTIAQTNNNLVVSVTTDKDMYYTGEPVNIKVCLTNNGHDTIDKTKHRLGEPVKAPDTACLHFSSSKHADFNITTKTNEHIFRWSHDKGFLGCFTGISIKHGETRELLSATWNQKDNNGNPVPPGKYYIDGWMDWSYYPSPRTTQVPIHGERTEITVMEEEGYITTNTQDNQPEIIVKKRPYYAPGAPEYVHGEFLVRFKPDVGEDAINTVNSKYGTSVKFTSPFIAEIKLLNVPSDKTVEEMVEIYVNLSEVEYAHPNYVVRGCMVPNDTATNTQDNQSEIFVKKRPYHAPNTVEYAPDGILVRFKPDVREDAINTVNSKYGTSVKESSPFISEIKLLNVPSDKTVEEMVKIYVNLSEVEYAHPNYVIHGCMVPNDPLYSLQWHLDDSTNEYHGINMESGWDISTGNGVVVAVLDSGVAYEDYSDTSGTYCQAPDLADTTFIQGYDFVNDDAHPNDDEGHGTHIAGTIAQTTNNDFGVAGVAFDCSIMPVKVLNETICGYHLWAANGIHYAVDNDADVICMSWAGLGTSPTLEDAVAYAYNEGVTLVAAVGDEYLDGNPTEYPAAYDDYVIAVGATTYNETRAYYSNTGSYLDLVAPGGDSSDQNGDGCPDAVLQQAFIGNPCKGTHK